MKSPTLGIGTSPAEVTNVDIHGIWVLVGDTECFLPHEDFPWFKKAKVEDILNLELHHVVHLCWSALDVDLSIDTLEHPERCPLVAEG